MELLYLVLMMGHVKPKGPDSTIPREKVFRAGAWHVANVVSKDAPK